MMYCEQLLPGRTRTLSSSRRRSRVRSTRMISQQRQIARPADAAEVYDVQIRLRVTIRLKRAVVAVEQQRRAR